MHLPFVALSILLLLPSLQAQIREWRDIAYGDSERRGAGSRRTSLDVYSGAPRGAKGDASWPVVVWIHGGGWRTGDKSRVRAKPQMLADAGFILVSVNYRMHPQVGYRQMAGDIAAAIRWTKEHAADHGGDGERIFLMGHSAGGHLAALVAADERYLEAEGLTLAALDGVVLLDGAGYDIPAHLRGAEQRKRMDIYAPIFSTDLERQAQASPITHVAADKGIPPVLIVHVADRRISMQQSSALARALRAADVLVSVYPAEGKTHATLNQELGTDDDEPSRVVLEFLDMLTDGLNPPARMHGARAVRRKLFTADGRREFLVHAHDGRVGPLPVVLVFHGGGGQARQMERYSGFTQLADEGAFIAVYPEGVDRSWNDGRKVELPRSPDREKIDDVAFTRAIIDLLSAEGEYQLDRSRIFATGISSGAFFCHRLAAEASDLVAGIAAVVGGMAPAIADAFAPEHPVSLLVIQGDSDPLVPLGGGRIGPPRGRDRGELVPTKHTIALYLERNALTGDTLPAALADTDPQDGTVTWDTIHRGDPTQAPVRVLLVENGGHTWPGTTPYMAETIIGRTSRDFEATPLIWEFFAGCPPR